MRKIIICALLSVFCSVSASTAQGLRDIRINEILVFNQESYADTHAKHVGWVELYNSGYSNVNIGGAYLSVKTGDDSRTYRIPKNDSRTLLPPQGYVIFFAEGTSDKGTFHTNFTLDDTGYVAFLDMEKNLIDEVSYEVADQKTDISIGRISKGTQTVFGPLNSITPLQSNEPGDAITADEKFRMADPSGIVMAITAMAVVFMALICLYLIFRAIGKYNAKLAIKKEAAAAGPVKPSSGKHEPTEEEISAIAMALKLWEEDMHDRESAIITINRVAKAYSPWSSKIYTLTQQPNRNR